MVASFFAETRRSLLHRHLYLCFYLLRLCEPQLSIELFYLLPLSFFLLFFLVFVIVAVLDLHLCKYLARRRCGSLDLNMYLLFFFFCLCLVYGLTHTYTKLYADMMSWWKPFFAFLNVTLLFSFFQKLHVFFFPVCFKYISVNQYALSSFSYAFVESKITVIWTQKNPTMLN